jgi:hypothetical protein
MSEPSTKTPAQAAAFAFAATPHFVDPTGVLGVYWLEPAGVLVRFMQPARGTTEMAQWMTSAGLDLVLRRYAPATDLSLVIDMRNMLGRSATARAALMHAATLVSDRFKHIVVLPSVHMGVAYGAVIEASAIALRLIGYRVDVEHDLEAALKKHGLRTQLLSDVRPAISR